MESINLEAVLSLEKPTIWLGLEEKSNALANGIIATSDMLFARVKFYHEGKETESIPYGEDKAKIRAGRFPVRLLQKWRESKTCRVNIPCTVNGETLIIRVNVVPRQKMLGNMTFIEALNMIIPEEDIYSSAINGKLLFGSFSVIPVEPSRMGGQKITEKEAFAFESLCNEFGVNHYGFANYVRFVVNGSNLKNGIRSSANKFKSIVPCANMLPMEAIKSVKKGEHIRFKLPCYIRDFESDGLNFLKINVDLRKD